MENKPLKIKPGDGLAPQGPLSRQLSSMKVGVRPPDIPMIEKVGSTLDRLKKKGSEIPKGSALVIRSIDGFIHFKDLTGNDLRMTPILRIIEFDPSRGTFLTSGEGEADVISEASWYVLKVLKDQHILLVIPEEGSSVELSKESEMRTRTFLDLSSRLFGENEVTSLGYRFHKFATLEELENFKGLIVDHSKSQ